MGSTAARTPHIDRLAAEGLAYTRGYVTTALCSPSLATLLTGLHPHQHGITGNDPVKGLDREAWLDRFFTHPLLPRMLADAGFVTLHTGKYWMRQPTAAGFTHDMGATDRHGGQALAIGRETMQPIDDFLDMSVRTGKPFFVWYAPFLPHTPHTPPARLLDRYADVADVPERKYLAMVEWFDETVGHLMTGLDRRGIAENTLVILLADNGWCIRQVVPVRERRAHADRAPVARAGEAPDRSRVARRQHRHRADDPRGHGRAGTGESAGHRPPRHGGGRRP